MRMALYFLDVQIGFLYPFISSIRNFDVIKCAEFMRKGEMRDERVDNIIHLIKGGEDRSEQIWEVNAPVQNDLTQHGVEEVEIKNEIVDAIPDVSTPKADDSCASTLRKTKKKFFDHSVE